MEEIEGQEELQKLPGEEEIQKPPEEDKSKKIERLVYKALNEIEALKKRPETPVSKPSEEITVLKQELALQKYMLKGYSEDEAKLILQAGENPIVLAGIEATRAKSKAEAGTPPPSPRTSTETPQTQSYFDLPKEDRKKFVRDLHWQKLEEKQRKVQVRAE